MFWRGRRFRWERRPQIFTGPFWIATLYLVAGWSRRRGASWSLGGRPALVVGANRADAGFSALSWR